MSDALLFFGFRNEETKSCFEDYLKTCKRSFRFEETLAGISAQQWDGSSGVIVQSSLLELPDEYARLERFQMVAKKPLVIFEFNPAETFGNGRFFALSPSLIFSGSEDQRALQKVLNFAFTFAVDEKEAAERIASDPSFLFFSSLSHELRELLNGLSALNRMIGPSHAETEVSKTLDSLLSRQKTALAMLEQWTAFVDESDNPTASAEYPCSVGELVRMTQTYFSNRLLFGALDPHWVYDPEDSEPVLANAMQVVFLWALVSSIILKVNESKRVEVAFSKIRNGVGLFLNFSLFFNGWAQNEASETDTRNSDANRWSALIIRKLLSLCRATVSVSRRGKDEMTVSVIAPVKEPAKAHHAVTEAAFRLKKDTRNGKLNILLAEDDLISQKLTALLVRKKGWSITVVSDGEEAVREITRRPYDIVLMDIRMPVMNGLEAARKIRSMEKAAFHHLPIIALTAHTLRDDRMTYAKAGIDACVSKPIVEDELYTTILQVWARFSETASYIENPPANINRVLSLLEGSKEELCGLIRESLRFFPEQLESIIDSIREKNAIELSKTAHKIKGSFSSFDAKRCFELALELEKAAKDQNLEDAEKTYRLLATETARLEEYLLNFL